MWNHKQRCRDDSSFGEVAHNKIREKAPPRKRSLDDDISTFDGNTFSKKHISNDDDNDDDDDDDDDDDEIRHLMEMSFVGDRTIDPRDFE